MSERKRDLSQPEQEPSGGQKTSRESSSSAQASSFSEVQPEREPSAAGSFGYTVSAGWKDGFFGSWASVQSQAEKENLKEDEATKQAEAAGQMPALPKST